MRTHLIKCLVVTMVLMTVFAEQAKAGNPIIIAFYTDELEQRTASSVP